MRPLAPTTLGSSERLINAKVELGFIADAVAAGMRRPGMMTDNVYAEVCDTSVVGRRSCNRDSV